MEYWQYHLDAYDGGIFPAVDGINVNTIPDDQFMGIVELTFSSVEDRSTWFNASTILMDDEHNIFSKAIGYNILGNTKTLVSRISDPYPNGSIPELRYHVMVRKTDSTSVEDFAFMTDTLMKELAVMPGVQLRYHLFDEIDPSRPDAQGAEHVEKMARTITLPLKFLLKRLLIVKLFLPVRHTCRNGKR